MVQWLNTERFNNIGRITKAELEARLNIRLGNVSDADSLKKQLREFRREQMFAIYYRDLVLHEQFEVTAGEVTWLAQTCLDAALNWHDADLSKRFGIPKDKSGNRIKMVVLGMGKLGAEELNVSSDIDLMFSFSKTGETEGGQRSLDNQAYFIRLGQQLIQTLDTVTADGFVFRVDMRLRPYGQSGALALSFSAMEGYYSDQGREWERYAMIKAAPVAGDLEAGRRLLDMLKPFVYRRYIDFGAIQSLRIMKDMIAKDVRRRGMANNIKIGDGGIREIEFIAQVFQLIRGGRVKALRQRSLLKILQVLAEEQLLPAAAVSELREAYIFLRNLEHAIQGIQDKQTQLIPDRVQDRERIAFSLGFADWKSAEHTLKQHRSIVAKHFANLIEEPAAANADRQTEPLWRQVWFGRATAEQIRKLFPDPDNEVLNRLLDQLAELRTSSRIAQLQTQGRERVDQFMPLLLQQFAEQQGDNRAFGRLLDFVDAVARRSAYLALLMENQQALKELIRLFNASTWIAEQIIRMPLLLDELLHSESLYSPPDTDTLRDELRLQMLRIPEDDQEEQMEALRYFKKAHVLRVAASELRETLPLMKVSDYLTFIAETILHQVFEEAWTAMTTKYGLPVKDDGSPCNKDFGIVGYGKLGGIELSYGSDLDIVFIHDCPASGETNGHKSIDNQTFFTRLAKRMIHLLTTKTMSGDVYEVDMRLRPSGNSGLLVSSMNALRQYQLEEAWTWEHQALVRTRCVCGTPQIREKFEAIRQEVLTQVRDIRKLREDVLKMREKMRVNMSTKMTADGKYPHFELKHDPGGIVDIEFMVQYAALCWAPEYPEVVRWSDNIRILEALAANQLMANADTDALCDIYRRYRSKGHLLALQNQSPKVDIEEFREDRKTVSAIWDKVFQL